MEVQQKQSIWGSWWTSIRKWFYPAWLMYETTYRFYDYALGTYSYIGTYQTGIYSNLGHAAFETFNICCSVLVFVICFVYLTIPGCLVLYKYFDKELGPLSSFEHKLKMIF